MTILSRRLSEAVTVEPWAGVKDPATKVTTPAYGPAVTVSALVTTAASDETIDIGQDSMNRRLKCRVYGGTTAVGGRDRITARGETWSVDGLPYTSKMVGGLQTTVFYIVKVGQGVAS